MRAPCSGVRLALASADDLPAVSGGDSSERCTHERRRVASLRRVSATSPPSLCRTPLFDRHLAAGAKLIDFAGWEMPVQYEGVREEHVAVRTEAGMFDVSHMGQIETSGPGSLALLQRLISNDLAKVAVGGAQYGVLCREDGGVLDDLFTYRLESDRWLTVTNASTHERDLEWFRAHAQDLPDVELADRIDDYAMLAVQGPRAREIVQAVSDAPLAPRMTVAAQRVGGAEALVCGTGYTGEDGVELLVAPGGAAALWDELARRGARPAGLAARDTLRLEACFCLYGNELSSERGPIEAGLGWCCAEDTGFIGSEAVRAVRERGPAERLVAFAIEGPGIARAGNPIAGGGVVTSGTLSPTLGIAVGLAYVPAGRAAVGTRLELDVRGKMRRAVVRAKPLYRRDDPC
jgi:aminomethyltransferase